MHSTGELQYSHVASDTVPNVLNIDRPQHTHYLSLSLSLGPPEKANGLFSHSRESIAAHGFCRTGPKVLPTPDHKKAPYIR